MTITMTPRQRLLAAFSRKDTDRPAVMPNLIRWIRGRWGCPCEMHQLQACETFGFDAMIMYGLYLNHPMATDYVYRPDGGYRDLPGVKIDIRVENATDQTIHIRQFHTPDGTLTDRIAWARPDMGYGDGPNPHREEPLVKSLDDIPALKHLYPAPRKNFVTDLKLFSQIVGERGVVEFLEGSNAGTWGMEALGPENMLICAVDNKPLLHAVLRVCQDQHLRLLKTVLESGHRHIAVSWFQCGPSVGWSPDHIKEFFHPLIRESVQLVKNYGAYYRYQDDGRMTDIFPFLADLGVDIVSGLQPPPVGDCVFGEIRKKWGNKICLMGALDPIYVFERGNQQTIQQAVEALFTQAPDGRGLVVGTAEAFGPDTPEECLYALSRAVQTCWQKK
ncbi:MAG: hypothetical protein NT011_05305 [Kiritimatiellaeota bacterium]|nr:hypothetical protein [Kiritimatiellota bacterium]